MLLLLKSTSDRKRLTWQLAVFLLVTAGLPAAWIARNHLVAGYNGFSAMSDLNLYFWNAAGVEAARTGRPLAQLQRQLGHSSEKVFVERNPQTRDWTPAQRYALCRREAWRLIGESPVTALAVHLHGMHSTLFDPGTQAFRDYFREEKQPPDAAQGEAPAGAWARLRRTLARRPLVAVLHAALWASLLSLLALALYGWLTQGHWRSMPSLLVFVALLYFLLLSGGPAGYHRFRLPLVPMLAVFAGAGWTSIRHRDSAAP
jgi:hypothetical protein